MKHTHRTLQLRRGQILGVFVKAGQQLVVQHGCVSLSTVPQGLAGTAWHSQQVIAAGEAHAVDANGWLSLSTNDVSAELLCVQAPVVRASITPLSLIHTLRALARRAFA